MDQEKLTEILAQFHKGIAQRLGKRLVGIYLYGSQARGDARLDSDIDVLVVIRGEFNYFSTLTLISDVAWKLSLENDVVISQFLVSDERYSQGDSPFLMNVHREAIPI